MFLNALQNQLLEDFNESTTENGAVGYRTTGKGLLDINFSVASLRSATETEIFTRFVRAYFEDKALAAKWLFFARDVRGGLGERRLFRAAFDVIATSDPDKAIKLIPLIPEYGRFDDLWPLLNNAELRPHVIKYVSCMLSSDMTNYNLGAPISLLAKWMPSANASSLQTKHYAAILQEGLNMSKKTYRKTLTSLRRYLDVVEVKMSSRRWDKIDYEKVPSRANLIYKNAFLRNDEERRLEYLSKLESGEAKINSSVLYPHDITNMYRIHGLSYYIRDYEHRYIDTAIEAMWKALPDMVGGCGNTIVVADSSGSMGIRVSKNSLVSAMDVAEALAVYFAERSSGEFKDKYITFSSEPALVDLGSGNSLYEKLLIMNANRIVSNTNVEAVFDLILNTAVNNKMSQEDMPANILIISDMEFDDCAHGNGGEMISARTKWWEPKKMSSPLFKEIERKYRDKGYKLPRLVFWNINSRTNTIPVRENDMGVALVSGFSVNICKMVMSGKTDPYECLLETINTERYKPVGDIYEG